MESRLTAIRQGGRVPSTDIFGLPYISWLLRMANVTELIQGPLPRSRCVKEVLGMEITIMLSAPSRLVSRRFVEREALLSWGLTDWTARSSRSHIYREAYT